MVLRYFALFISTRLGVVVLTALAGNNLEATSYTDPSCFHSSLSKGDQAHRGRFAALMHLVPGEGFHFHWLVDWPLRAQPRTP
jgi:hypothetical protein